MHAARRVSKEKLNQGLVVDAAAVVSEGRARDALGKARHALTVINHICCCMKSRGRGKGRDGGKCHVLHVSCEDYSLHCAAVNEADTSALAALYNGSTTIAMKGAVCCFRLQAPNKAP